MKNGLCEVCAWTQAAKAQKGTLRFKRDELMHSVDACRVKIRPHYSPLRPVELAREAFVAAGLKPYDHVIRGGTVGSRLTELGLPTPNLFCGEHNAHGPLEWVAVQDMEWAVTACTHLAELWERKS
jgi:acetylornithine deacetylase/succinyl-diaminopimelate desuccinylase-like protein